MSCLKEVIAALTRLAPLELAESWDNVGLMIGAKSQEVRKVLCALDVNEAVIDEAIEGGYECIVSHHPFLFAPIKKLDLEKGQGKLIAKLIKNDIAVYSMHTNYDIAQGGLNDYLSEKLGLEQIKILQKTASKKFCKVIVYVPDTHLEVVREVIINENPCTIGNYRGCTFSSKGEGTFMPLEGSNPFIGQANELEYAKEQKLEFMAYEQDVQRLIALINKVHPYEEVAFDVYELKNIEEVIGLGRVGKLPQKVSFETFIEQVKAVFKVPYVRVTEDLSKPVEKVAICSGSGAEFIKIAAQKADVYITGDLKFHEGQKAKELGLAVIDVGHYASENIAMQHIASYLSNEIKDLEVACSKVNGETLNYR